MNLFEEAKRAAAQVALLPDETRADALNTVADAIVAQQDKLLSANAEDLARMDPASPLYDRLRLTPERLAGIAVDMRHVAALPSPLGRILDDRTLPNGLRLRFRHETEQRCQTDHAEKIKLFHNKMILCLDL